jgi:putative transposase
MILIYLLLTLFINEVSEEKYIYKGYEYRIYPTKEQEWLINQHLNAVRIIYNDALRLKIWVYKAYGLNLSRFELQAQLPELKEEAIWLKEINATILQTVLANLDIAYINFFKYGYGYPKFKRKYGNQSYQYVSGRSIHVDFDKKRIKLPNFKSWIKFKHGNRQFDGEIRNVTVKRTPSGKYFISFCVKELAKIQGQLKPIDNDSKCVGVDVGLKTFASLSDGTSYDNQRHLAKLEARIKYEQRCMARMQKGSKRRNKKRKKIAKLHEKTRNRRTDFIQKTSSEIVNKYDVIAVETLKIENMMANHCLAKAIGDAGWGNFKQMLKYKAIWKGKHFIEIGVFEPSSKTCSNCKHKHTELKLSDRTWICEKCGVEHDRDLNASVNILNFGLTKYGGEQHRDRTQSYCTSRAKNPKGKEALISKELITQVVDT